MTVNYGQAPDPGQYIIALLTPLGLPVGRTVNLGTSLPAYMVNILPGKSDKYILCATASVHSFATDPNQNQERAHDLALNAAQAADTVLISQMPSDIVTLANGKTAGGLICPQQPPMWVDYKDPFIIRYVARYSVELRYTATGSVT
jgi:hypothetical protein